MAGAEAEEEMDSQEEGGGGAVGMGLCTGETRLAVRQGPTEWWMFGHHNRQVQGSIPR